MNVMAEHKLYCPFVNGKMQCAVQGHGHGGQVEDGKLSNAWQQRLQVLVGGASGGQVRLSILEMRKMKSSEVLAKVKSLMM